MGGEAGKTVAISTDDLASGKVLVVGRLGIPLQRMAAFRGIWRYPDQSDGPTKRYSLSLQITHVDGKLLPESIEFDRASVDITFPLPWVAGDKGSKQPTPAEGDVWEIRGFETGGFRGSPAEFEKELRSGARARPRQIGAWERSFQTQLRGIVPKPR